MGIVYHPNTSRPPEESPKRNRARFRIVEIEQGNNKTYRIQKRYCGFFWLNFYSAPYCSHKRAIDAMRGYHDEYVRTHGTKVKRVLDTL